MPKCSNTTHYSNSNKYIIITFQSFYRKCSHLIKWVIEMLVRKTITSGECKTMHLIGVLVSVQYMLFDFENWCQCEYT